MIRRFLTFRPALIYGFALLWTFHFSFGAFFHYHPEYTHGHTGALESHHHGGHFHSLELDRLAEFLHHSTQPLAGGETHHHSEGLPGSEPESAQYDFNSSSLPEIKLVLDAPLETASASWTLESLAHLNTLILTSETQRILFLPQSPSERSPPLTL